MARINPLLDRLAPYPVTELDRIRDQVRASGHPLYDFSLGDPPDPTPAFIRDALCRAIPEISQYPTVMGSDAIRSAICFYLRRRFGVEMDPATQVLPTSGSKEAIFHLPMAVIDPAREDRLVVFPDPGYPAYERGTLFAGGIPKAVPISADHRFHPWDLDPEILRRTRILYINTPNNPTGVVATLEELGRTWELCRQYEILLVSDECYCDIYDAEPPPSILQVSTEGVLVVHSLSKRSGMTGYRAGFLAGDPAWIARMRRLRANPGLLPQEFVNAAAQAAWLDDSHVALRRRRFRDRRKVMADFLREKGLDFVASHAGLYIWFRAPSGHDDFSYASHLLQVGIVVTPGRLLASTDAGLGWLRLALVPDLAGCKAAIEAWSTLNP